MKPTPHTVIALTTSARVIINYDTGTTELRRLDGPPVAGTVVHIPPSTPAWGTNEAPAVLPANGFAPIHWRLGAIPAILITAAARSCGPRARRFRRLVRLARYGSRRPPATLAQAEFAVRAVRRASTYFPARWACLEESVAATTLLALAGFRGEWRHGLASEPRTPARLAR
ncbi:lasso peptide biosynthesis B2 protein [Streptomyces sp. NBC_01525]|uniref:lasso peptide biosynthesis B2 protein n=1 Tax=Streptomyces sp. NBC_01525 TaxID=2903893 RepID=UPI003862E4F7